MTKFGRNADEMLAFVALAEIEQKSRTPLTESASYSSLTTLLIGILPDVDRLALSCAASGVLANALANRVPQAQPRNLTKWFPKEAPRLSLAAQRLKASLVHHEISPELQAFTVSIADAKQATLEFIMADSMSGVRQVASAWRRSCTVSARLIRAMDQVFGQRSFSGFEASAQPLLDFLDEVAAGSYAALDENGLVDLSHFYEGEEREARRVPLTTDAVIVHGDYSCRVTLTDMSLGGLGLDNIEGIKAGARVKVTVGAMELSGTLEWVRGKRGGVCLDQRLDERDPRLSFLSQLRD